MSSPRFASAAAFAALAALLVSSAPAPARAQSKLPDLSAYQALLDQYIVRVPGDEDRPGSIRFDYEQLYVDEKIWSKKSSDRLQAVHAQLLAAPPSSMDERTRLAWAINTYNFLVIERATMHLLVPLRGFQRYESVLHMKTMEGGFFDGRWIATEGGPWSLAEFERRFVYGDTLPLFEPRARAGDPRVMFALCHGTTGGPDLFPRAFRPESLDAQLDQAARSALARPTYARFDERSRTLLASNYMAQRRLDFGGTTAGIAGFVLEHGPKPLRSQLKRARVTDVLRFMPLDDKLNLFERPKPKAPTPESKTSS